MKTLTDNAASFPNVIVPQDGVDRRTAATVEVGFQRLANRTAWLKDLVVGAGAGVSRIRTFATSTELQNFAAPKAGDVALSPGLGLYVFITSGTVATATPDGLYIFAPSDGTPGRWVHVIYGLLNIGYGIPTIDAATNKVKADKLHRPVLDVQVWQNDDSGLNAYTAVYANTSWTTINDPGAPLVVVPNCSAGDVLEIDGFVWVYGHQTGTSGVNMSWQIRLAAGPSDTVLSPVAASYHELNPATDDTLNRVSIHGQFVVASAGANRLRIQAQVASTAGAPWLNLRGPGFLRVRRVQP